jgi:hypothetical protein
MVRCIFVIHQTNLRNRNTYQIISTLTIVIIVVVVIVSQTGEVL